MFLLKRCSLGTSDIQGCYSPKGITYMIYTLIHERDPIPCRTTYIEYRSPVNILINQFFEDHHRIPLVFIAKEFFFIVLWHQSWGYPSVSLKRSLFKYNIKRNWSFRGARFSCWNVLVEELQTSRVATPQRELRNYIMYTLIRPLCMKETQFLAELHT